MIVLVLADDVQPACTGICGKRCATLTNPQGVDPIPAIAGSETGAAADDQFKIAGRHARQSKQ